MALDIYIVEADDAETFKLYDRTVWAAYDHDDILAATISVVYDGDTYTHNILVHLGGGPTLGGATSVNLCGTSVNSYYEVHPHDLLNGSTPLNTVYFLQV
jgi:hypothetical protein